MARDGRPNIVVMIADDHRGTELGHLPRSGARTPALDALAARGVSFAGAHCQGAMHGAVCVPSRASVLTGRNIFASSDDPTGADYRRATTIPADLETFPQVLRRVGYRTHAVGKWHNDTASFTRSFAGGEALMFGGMSDHRHVPIRSYRLGPGRDGLSEVREADGFSSDIFADAAIDFLNEEHNRVPFLLYVAFTAPHDPRTPPPGWTVDPETIELPPNFLPVHPFDNGDMYVRDEQLAGLPRTKAGVRRHIADYYGMIAHLDHSIGRVLGALDANGLTGDTIVIYTGDHGLAVGQHGLMGKQNLYEHSLRVPLVIAGPGVPAGVVSRQLVWHADTTATIRALCGLAPDPAAEGLSYITDGGTIAMRDTLGAAFEYGQRMFRDERYKLIRYQPIPANAPKVGSSPGSEMVQLFDLDADLWEMTNLAGDPAYAETQMRLEDGLRAWQTEVGDELLALHDENRVASR